MESDSHSMEWVTPIAPAPVAPCNPTISDCNVITAKLPIVTVATHSGARAATAGLDSVDKAAFEHLIGTALAETRAVRWATRAFASRCVLES